MSALRISLLLVVYSTCALQAQPAMAGGVPKEIAKLAEQLRQVSAEVERLRERLGAAEAELASLKGNSALDLDGVVALTSDPAGAPVVLLTGVNLQLVNGTNSTQSANGLGNIVLGYNADNGAALMRQGSHNLVIGDGTDYPGTAEILADRITAGQDLDLVVGDQMTLVVGTDLSMSVGANLEESIGGNATLVADQSILIEAGDALVLKSGDAVASLDASGDIDVDGKDITISGSGEVEVKASGDLLLKGSSIQQN